MLNFKSLAEIKEKIKYEDVSGIYVLKFKNEHYVGSSVGLYSRIMAHAALVRRKAHPTKQMNNWSEKTMEAALFKVVPNLSSYKRSAGATLKDHEYEAFSYLKTQGIKIISNPFRPTFNCRHRQFVIPLDHRRTGEFTFTLDQLLVSDCLKMKIDLIKIFELAMENELDAAALKMIRSFDTV